MYQFQQVWPIKVRHEKRKKKEKRKEIEKKRTNLVPDAHLRGRVDITRPPATAMGLIEIDEPLQEVQEDLYAKGHALSELLRGDYPDVVAIKKAIDDIESALTFDDKVCKQWVTSHVVQTVRRCILRTFMFAR